LIINFFQATGSWDFTVKVWTLNNSDDSVVTMEGHKGNIHAVAFSKDGMLVRISLIKA
jgi:WD40 repeat protein